MRFLDENIFIYAFYKPKKRLSEKENQMKEEAQKIIANVSSGKEQVLLTVVHLSEVVNILKHGMQQEQLASLIHGLFTLDNLKIADVTRDAYFAATELGEDLKLEPNDALAIDVMRQNDVSEIYSFDEHFSQVDGVIRLPSI